MTSLTNRKVAILSTHGFEQSELQHPVKALRDAGADVHVIAPESGEIRCWDAGDWGESVPVDHVLKDVVETDYDALVLPGGQINPDILRGNKEAVSFIQRFFDAKKPIGAICHAPWLLVEAGAAKGRKMTSFHTIRTDVENAGAHWVDAEVVCDQAIVTSRSPEDLDAFSAKMIEEIAEGRHMDRAA